MDFPPHSALLHPNVTVMISAVDVRGQGSNVVLVAISPAAQDAACWQWLTQDFDIKPEYPGHAQGAKVPDWFTLEQLADDVASQISEPADIIGVAMGSLVAQHLALRHPDKVRSLVLACAPARMVDGKAYVERAVSGLLHGMEHVANETAPRWFSSEGLSADLPGVAYAMERLRTFSPVTFAQIWGAVAGHRLGSRLAAINCPTTVVSGRYDASASEGELWELHELIPGSRFLSLEGPHMMHLERPCLLSEAIDVHLAWAASIL